MTSSKMWLVTCALLDSYNKCTGLDFRRLLDVLLGACLASLVYGQERDLSSETLKLLDSFALWLTNTIQWLMGNPAGLKLNRPLNEVLGSFFLYHIYLWRANRSFLEPVIPLAIRYLFVYSQGLLLGASFQLSVLGDAVNLLSLHVYCLHIYTARLYRVFVVGLLSLWRLFRGRKYNPLRDRVDTGSFEPQQLFLGTLMFTVLLFLLPTVLVYYVVFAMMWLLIRFFQKVVLVLVALLTGIWDMKDPATLPERTVALCRAALAGTLI